MSNAPIAMDLGGSEVRRRTGDKVLTKPSTYKIIAPTAKAYSETPNPLDDMLIKNAPISSLKGLRVLKEGAFSMHAGDIQRANNQHKKHLQDVTYINAIHACATSIVENNIKPGGNNVVRLFAGVVIPASEFYTDGVEDVVKNNLAGNYEVYFPVLTQTVRFSISKKDLILTPEGIIALYPKLKGKQANLIKQGNGILIDPGRITTEIVLVHKFKPDAGTAMSYPIAGSMIEAFVSNRLTRMDLPATQDDIINAIENGFVSVGKDEIPVGTIVQEAKINLAKKLYDSIIEVVNTAGNRIQNYHYLAPIGRCFHVSGTPGDSRYTGSLLEELLKLVNFPIGLVEFETLDEENVNGVYDVLKRKVEANLGKSITAN